MLRYEVVSPHSSYVYTFYCCSLFKSVFELPFKKMFFFINLELYKTAKDLKCYMLLFCVLSMIPSEDSNQIFPIELSSNLFFIDIYILSLSLFSLLYNFLHTRL